MRRMLCAIPVAASLCLVRTALAANAVYVESKTVVAGALGVDVGIYLSNIPPLAIMHLPFEIRAVTPGSFIADTISLTGTGRLTGYFGDAGTTLYYAQPDDSLGCWVVTEPPDFASPDMVRYYSGGGMFQRDRCLPSGSDGLPPTGTPSLVLHFNVTDVPGTFEIDSTCVWHDGPEFVDCMLSYIFPPSFTKGVITIVPCACACHGDPECDGRRDVLDILAMVGETFRRWTPVEDVDCGRGSRADINCDCRVDVADVVGMIDVVVRGEDGATVICDGCSNQCPGR
ncbi:MAG: hypothetical protein AB1792_07840 [Candidatus Zixiibacteriota bacterium]